MLVEPRPAKCLLIGRDSGVSPLINVLFNSNRVRRTLSNTNPSISKICGIQNGGLSHMLLNRYTAFTTL